MARCELGGPSDGTRLQQGGGWPTRSQPRCSTGGRLPPAACTSLGRDGPFIQTTRLVETTTATSTLGVGQESARAAERQGQRRRLEQNDDRRNSQLPSRRELTPMPHVVRRAASDVGQGLHRRRRQLSRAREKPSEDPLPSGCSSPGDTARIWACAVRNWTACRLLPTFTQRGSATPRTTSSTGPRVWRSYADHPGA